MKANLALGLAALLLAAAGCGKNSTPPPPGGRAGNPAPQPSPQKAAYQYERDPNLPPETQWVKCIGALEQVYRHKGVAEFRKAKTLFAESTVGFDKDPGYYEIAGFFLDPKHTVVAPAGTKAAQDEAREVLEWQALMKQIEDNPGKSLKTWHELHGKVYVLWTGSSNPSPPLPVMSVLHLYRVIALGLTDENRNGL
jgi:hypothetical protein